MNLTADEHLTEKQGDPEKGSDAWSQVEPAPSPPAVPGHVTQVFVFEKSVKQWSFFIKTLGLDFFSSSKSYFEYLVQAN